MAVAISVELISLVSVCVVGGNIVVRSIVSVKVSVMRLRDSTVAVACTVINTFLV